MSFAGFGPEALPFFKALGFHQTKEWFEANRALYESQVKNPFGDLVEDVSAACAKSGLPFRGDRKRSLFRIYRDVRFAKDKSPYKTNAGAVLTRGGAKNDKGLLYIHIDPEGCFVAAGFYHPEPEDLTRLRKAIVRDPKGWKRTESLLAGAGLALSEGHGLKRTPRGFEQVTDPALIMAIRNKSFICSRPIADARLTAAALVDDIHSFAKEALPLMEWGWSAIVDVRD